MPNEKVRFQIMNSRVSDASCRRLPKSVASALLVGILLASGLVSVGCSDSDSKLGSEASGEAAQDPSSTEDIRPSIVLVVIESLRTDAVASYGPDRGSPLPVGEETATPHLDALAVTGTRYAWAIAASPETVASHASILTGLRADQHGAGLWTNPIVTNDLEMIAETLGRDGYETVGLSENVMVGPEFGFDQGFDRFVTPKVSTVARQLGAGHGVGADFGIVDRVRRWLNSRDSNQPYFLFLNLADPHMPFERHTNNRFMPKGVSEARIDGVASSNPQFFQLCRELPDPESIDILGALYLANVEAADQKLGAIVELTRANATAKDSRAPNMIVTADHGALFGEQRLVGHQFSVNNRVLRIPLVVALSEPRVGVIEAPIAQRRIAASIRCWAAGESTCRGGLPLDEPTTAEPIISILGNEVFKLPAAAVVDTGSLVGKTNHGNARCEEDEGFAGRSLSYIKAPMKFIWRQRAPSQLFDLSWDPNESFDQTERQAEVARALQGEVEGFVVANRIDQVHRQPPEGSLPERALLAYEAARQVVLASDRVDLDTIWFAQLCFRVLPDPEIAAWIETRIPNHKQDRYYPIIAPESTSPKMASEKLGHGLDKWGNYLGASVQGPDEIALPQLDEYLAMDAEGYILTHQLSTLEWARAMGRPLSAATLARGPEFLAKITQEHAANTHFSDLWAEQAAFLTVFGDPTPATIENWAAFIVEHHLGNGDWGNSGAVMAFDGHRMIYDHSREHVRGLAMVVLAHYLALTSSEG